MIVTNYKPGKLISSEHAKLNRGYSYVLYAIYCQKLYRVSLTHHLHFDHMNFLFYKKENFKVTAPCYVLITGRSIFTIENTTVSLA